VREGRGEDPDDLAVVLEEVAEDFDKMLVELRRLASEEGIDLDAPLPPVPIVLDAVRLRVAGHALVVNAGQLSDRSGDELATTALIIAIKAARIAGYLSDVEECEVWDADAVPNLLLLQSLLEALRHGLRPRRGSEVEFVVVEGDDLDDEERARLHAALDRADEELRAGTGIPAAQVIAELRRGTP
jgi:hypothetical protein